MRGLARARERWALTGRRDRPGTACAARAELGGYCLRFRAPRRATIWRRAPLQRCGAASDGHDLSSPTHRSSTPKGGMDARAMGCCHAPACVRVRTQPPCLPARAPLVAQPSAGRAATVAARPASTQSSLLCAHSGLPRRAAGVTRCVLPHALLCAPPIPPPPWHCLRPRALAPLCVGEAAGMAAALR